MLLAALRRAVSLMPDWFIDWDQVINMTDRGDT